VLFPRPSAIDGEAEGLGHRLVSLEDLCRRAVGVKGDSIVLRLPKGLSGELETDVRALGDAFVAEVVEGRSAGRQPLPVPTFLRRRSDGVGDWNAVGLCVVEG